MYLPTVDELVAWMTARGDSRPMARGNGSETAGLRQVRLRHGVDMYLPTTDELVVVDVVLCDSEGRWQVCDSVRSAKNSGDTNVTVPSLAFWRLTEFHNRPIIDGIFAYHESLTNL
jgi:hypothetical protein